MNSLRIIIAVSRINFNYWKRNRIVYGFFVAGILFLAIALITTLLGPRIRDRIILDLGFAAVELIGWIAFIFMGATTLLKQIENKSIYFYLSKPLGREHLLLGTFAGLLRMLFYFYAILAGIFAGFLVISGVAITPALALLFYFLFLKLSIILAVGIFFSSYSTSMIASILLTVATIIIGYLTQGIDYYTRVGAPSTAVLIFYRCFQIVFPYMEHYNINAYLLEHGSAGLGLHTAAISLYTFGYILFITGISTAVFRRRDL